MQFVRFSDIPRDKFVNLPASNFSKVLILDMDETMIHCVDDIESQEPDVILEIDFPGEETVCAGINIRPYLQEMLEEANKTMQVIVFTASHQTYADAILDYIDPERTLISYRMYRQHCVQTPEGLYVKDLRVIRNRELKDVVLVDNSVYSFAYQIDNGIPIISYYDDPRDEELVHLIGYLQIVAESDDVRVNNREAFELFKLGEGANTDDQEEQTWLENRVSHRYSQVDEEDDQMEDVEVGESELSNELDTDELLVREELEPGLFSHEAYH